MVELQANFAWMALIYVGFWFSKSPYMYDYLFGRRSFSCRKLGVVNNHWLFSFHWTLAILTLVISNFRRVFIQNHIFSSSSRMTLPWNVIEFSSASFDLYLKSLPENAHSKVKNWIFNAQFPENWFNQLLCDNCFRLTWYHSSSMIPRLNQFEFQNFLHLKLLNL